MVRCASPMWPAMRLPGKTLLGLWFWPVEPGFLCDTELPWVARFEEKLWRLMTPANPLPCVVPLTSTFCPTVKMSAPTVLPGCSDDACSSLTRNSFNTEPASTPALAKWPGRRLDHAAGTAPAVGDLDRRIAIRGGSLDLGHAIVRHVHDRHRHGVAVVGEQPRHADLAAH